MISIISGIIRRQLIVIIIRIGMSITIRFRTVNMSTNNTHDCVVVCVVCIDIAIPLCQVSVEFVLVFAL